MNRSVHGRDRLEPDPDLATALALRERGQERHVDPVQRVGDHVQPQTRSTGAGPCEDSHALTENCEIEPLYKGIKKILLLEVALAGLSQ